MARTGRASDSLSMTKLGSDYKGGQSRKGEPEEDKSAPTVTENAAPIDVPIERLSIEPANKEDDGEPSHVPIFRKVEVVVRNNKDPRLNFLVNCGVPVVIAQEIVDGQK